MQTVVKCPMSGLGPDFSASKIQAAWRGYKVRQTLKGNLSPYLFSKALDFIKQPSQLKDIPRAEFGHTPVYMPVGLPIIFKECGLAKASIRMQKMQDARTLCFKHQLFNLVVPDVRSHEGYLIESKLPLPSLDAKAEIGLYLTHKDKFDDAVVQFTKLLILSDFQGVLTTSRHPYQALIADLPILRYDNVSLYLDKGIGKIGLIDLEHFSPKSQNQFASNCLRAIYIFPCHLDLILKTVELYYPSIKDLKNECEQASRQSLTAFQSIYGNHRDFLNKKKIDMEYPFELSHISGEVLENLKQQALQSLEKTCNHFMFLGSLSEETFSNMQLKIKVEAHFDQILNLVIEFLKDVMKGQKDLGDLVMIRTIHLNKNKGRVRDLLDQVVIEVKEQYSWFSWFYAKPSPREREAVSIVLKILFNELANLDIIAYSNTTIYSHYLYSDKPQMLFC